MTGTMITTLNTLLRGLLVAGLLATTAAGAQEAAIRKNLTERLPMMGTIDEVTKTPMPGIFEVRVGTDLYYTDADGSYVMHGQLVDARQRRNLTEERIAKLTAIDFDKRPTKDAFQIVRGNGKRKLALFED